MCSRRTGHGLVNCRSKMASEAEIYHNENTFTRPPPLPAQAKDHYYQGRQTLAAPGDTFEFRQQSRWCREGWCVSSHRRISVRKRNDTRLWMCSCASPIAISCPAHRKEPIVFCRLHDITDLWYWCGG